MERLSQPAHRGGLCADCRETPGVGTSDDWL